MNIVELLITSDWQDRIMLASIVIARNVINESPSVDNHEQRVMFARQILQNPYTTRANFAANAASMYDPTGWETKTEQEKKNDTEYLITQVFNEVGYIVSPSQP